MAVITTASLVACGSSPSYDQVEGTGGAASAPGGTAAVNVTQRNPGSCGGTELECAERSAMEALLFTGVPGTSLPRPMVPNEKQARRQHSDYFDTLFEGGEYQRYVVRVVEGGEAAYTVVLNHAALRRNLEQAGVIRKFGR
jgi:hypothetical protein